MPSKERDSKEHSPRSTLEVFLLANQQRITDLKKEIEKRPPDNSETFVFKNALKIESDIQKILRQPITNITEMLDFTIIYRIGITKKHVFGVALTTNKDGDILFEGISDIHKRRERVTGSSAEEILRLHLNPQNPTKNRT